jgi:hypothetical protein
MNRCPGLKFERGNEGILIPLRGGGKLRRLTTDRQTVGPSCFTLRLWKLS